jgi:hypothetical protein
MMDDRKKPGPTPGPKIGTAVITGYVIGRDNIIVPPEQVQDLAEIGCTDQEICDFFGISGVSTLRYNFSSILLKGRETLKQRLRRAMLHNALVNNHAIMQIFLAKNMLGMSDNGMGNGNKQTLPFSDDEDDFEVNDDMRDDMKEELIELNATQ